MKTKKCKQDFHIINFDEFDNLYKTSDKKRHGILFPNHCRVIVCGPSGCGKTNIMLNLIINEHGLKFENIYIYCKSLFQSKYKILQLILRSIKTLQCHFFDQGENIIPPKEAKKNSLFIFDDVICDKQNIMTSYFAMGRHCNIDVFYLAQTYSKIPKQIIRDNANILILFKQDETNIKHIYDDHVNTDMSFNSFKTLCQMCWDKKHDFLFLDKESDLYNGRYRHGFDTFFTNF